LVNFKICACNLIVIYHFIAFFSDLATKIKTKSEEIKQDLKKVAEELTKNNDGPTLEIGINFIFK